MKRTMILIGAVMFLMSGAAAQNPSDNADPGLIGPNSPLHGFDRAYDSVFKSPSDVLLERAAEVRTASRDDDVNTTLQAVERFNQASTNVDRSEAEKASVAENVLNNLRSQVAQEARQGISIAIDNAIKVQNRPSVAEKPSTPPNQLPSNP